MSGTSTQYITLTYWNNLRIVYNSSIVRSTYIWIIVVPSVAGFLSKINDSIKFTIDGVSYELVMELPFSWQLFFYSSLCFVLGNIIFMVAAPQLIKDYRDFGEYLGSRRNVEYLSRYMPRKYRRRYEKLEHLAGVYTSPDNKEGEIIFWRIYDEVNLEYPFCRYTCASLYLFGFALFAYVAIKTILWVLAQ